jgi:GH35 family endo-1,4-beta-xylanase
MDSTNRLPSNRTGQLEIETRPRAAVKVTQLKHEFMFGSAISSRVCGDEYSLADRQRYFETFRTHFNGAVHENALKWYATERERGEVSYAQADALLRWCEQNGIQMRGHCLFWAVPRFVQDWVKNLPDGELREAVRRRAAEVARRYRGRIDDFDLNNEMLAGSFYRDRLGEDIIARMCASAKEGNPHIRLCLNEFAIVSGDKTEEYIKLIDKLLNQGLPIGGINCQAHFNEMVDVGHVRQTLDRLAAFGLPIKLTEYDFKSEDEQAKAEHLDAFYRTCFAHPSVDGILMWGFWERAHWKPSAALWKKDWTPTPAVDAYERLVFDEWWTRWEGRADDDGRCRVPAFFGRHCVQAGGEQVEITVSRKDGSANVSI